MEMSFDNVCVFVINMLFGEGWGFEIVQGCLGLGCIYYCMCLVGQVECVLELMIECSVQCIVFGKLFVLYQYICELIVQSCMEIDQVWLLMFKVVYIMDIVGNKDVKGEIVVIKVVVLNMVLCVIDCVIQVYGGVGVCQDILLVMMYVQVCILCFVDGFDIVYIEMVVKEELCCQGVDLWVFSKC